MTRKGSLLFWTDLLNGVLFLSLIITGSILKWVLPPGSGGGGGGEYMGRGFRGGRGPAATLASLTRHEWGDVQFWIALSLVALILLHLALHWGWLRASIWHCLPSPRHAISPEPRSMPGPR